MIGRYTLGAGARGVDDRTMTLPLLTGAQKAELRGRGQRLEAALKVGKDGLTPALMAELRRLLRRHELVKVRLLGSDRHARSKLCEEMSAGSDSLCVGAVGQTALFYAPSKAPSEPS
jgi:RNA-binding protein